MKNKYFKVIKNSIDGVQLFCFPYAGGNASLYYPWKEKIHKDIELISLQLPGRADLLNVDLIVDLDILVDVLYKAIKPYLDKPFAFFGHSMGGVLVYALTAYIEKRIKKIPKFIIISATKPPHFYYRTEDYLLSNEELKKQLKENDATPDEILNSEEFMDIIIPIYRADCKLLGTNRIKKEAIKTKVFLFNSEEDIEKNIMIEWNEYFREKAKYIKFNGGHFFIHSQEEDVIKTINKIVKGDKLNV